MQETGGENRVSDADEADKTCGGAASCVVEGDDSNC